MIHGEFSSLQGGRSNTGVIAVFEATGAFSISRKLVHTEWLGHFKRECVQPAPKILRHSRNCV